MARFPRLDVADKNRPVVPFAHAVEKMRVDLGRPSLHGETRRGSKKLKQVVSQIRWIDAQTHRHSEYSIGVGRMFEIGRGRLLGDRLLPAWRGRQPAGLRLGLLDEALRHDHRGCLRLAGGAKTKSGKYSRAASTQAAKNAAWAKEKFAARWVTPVLCVGSDEPQRPEQRNHVWVMSCDQLRPWLLAQPPTTRGIPLPPGVAQKKDP